MDINGVWAAVNFPSMVTGFCGRVFFNADDSELGAACIRAWNDWLFEEWYTAHPTRIIPLGIAMLSDPEAAVAEIHRNAERGFTAISMPERPDAIGLPSLWERDHWDPIIQACVDTDTVVSLHVGSSGSIMGPPGSPGLQIGATLFGQLSLHAATEWLWSEYPVKHPTLKIAMSEGGIGWVAMLHDRLENIVDRSGYGSYFAGDLRPAEVLARNFWFCTIDDPSTLVTRETVGIDHIMFETDYPHGDGTWPDSQAVFASVFGHLPPDEVAKISHENAAALFRHPLPPPDSPHAAGLRT
jgi:predicted TIM-barrel fold metal-dependent hydrolase